MPLFGYEHKPASLFLITQAQSGAGKTQVNRLAYKSIYQHDRQAYKEYIALMDEYINARDNLRGKERAEYLATHDKPTNPTITLKDATTESLLDRFVMMESYNQSWASDDAGQFFGGHDLKSDTNASTIANYAILWSSGEAHRMRSTRTKGATHHTNAYNCRMTLDLAGQAVIIKPAIDDPLLSGQGLLARCLFSAEPSLIGKRDWLTESNPHQDPILKAYWQTCTALLNRGMPTHADGTPNRQNMPFGKGAKRALQEFQQKIEYEQAKGGRLEHHTAFASRMAENATRIATLLAFFGGYEYVECQHLQGAFELVQYSMNEILYYGESVDEPSDIEKLLAWLIKKAKDHPNYTLNRSFISQNAPNALRGKKLGEFLEDLESLSYVKLENVERKKLVMLNPKLFKK